MKAQSAFEYLIITGIVITFLIPVWAYVLSTQQYTSDELSLSYAKSAVKKITNTANLVYSQGPPARVTLNVYMPGGIQSVIAIDNTLDLAIKTSSGISDIYDTSTAVLNFTENLNETLSKEGMYVLKIEAKDNVVQISMA